MDYKYIHPVFTEDDKDIAIDFLANQLLEMITIYNEKTEVDKAQHLSKNFLKQLFMDIVKKLYGVNVVTMANFSQVQKIFYDKYAAYIIKYLNLCGINAQIVNFCPTSVSPYAISKYMQYHSNKPLSYFDPNDHWNFQISNDIGVNLMNPLNIMDIVILRLRDIKEYMPDLIRALFKRDATKDELEYNNLDLKILPNNDISELMDLVRILNIIF